MSQQLIELIIGSITSIALAWIAYRQQVHLSTLKTIGTTVQATKVEVQKVAESPAIANGEAPSKPVLP